MTDKNQRFQNELISCPQPEQIPLSLQYLEVHAATRQKLEGVKNEAREAEKAQKIEKFQSDLEEMVFFKEVLLV